MFSHSVICMQDPHVLSLCYLHAGSSFSLTLLMACTTPHVLSLCFLHAGRSSLILLLSAGPSCSLTLLFACRTLMFSHSAICMQDSHSHVLHSSNCMQDPHVLSLCYLHAGLSLSCPLILLIACRTLMFSHSAQDPHVLPLC